MTPEAWAVARERAAQDRDTLARLVAEGKVMRSGPTSALTRDIARRAKPKINLAIRPNAKKRRRR